MDFAALAGPKIWDVKVPKQIFVILTKPPKGLRGSHYVNYGDHRRVRE